MLNILELLILQPVLRAYLKLESAPFFILICIRLVFHEPLDKLHYMSTQSNSKAIAEWGSEKQAIFAQPLY
jgi:hypothetical protein